jgi:Transposase, Mutator family
MNIVERGRAFLQGLRGLADRPVWEWRRCPRCGETETCKWGHYQRRPWFLSGRQTVRVQRHRCHGCGRTYSEGSALLVRGGWYAREVKRSAIDHWQHLGTSTRRTAEVLRSWLGQQERWQVWRPLDPAPSDATACHLSASTVERWLDQAGATAKTGVAEHLVGVESSGQMATDGLWARLRGGTKRVVLALVDNVTGVVWPPVMVAGEGTAAAWGMLFARAEQAGLLLSEVRGIASDGATGLESYRRQALPWVSHQRCVFHLWRGLSGALATAVATAVAATELTGAAARRVAKHTRRTLIDLVRSVYDAATEAEAQAALARLAAHELGQALAELVAVHLEAAHIHRCGYNQGLGRASPEWLWRDFRLRSSHGRNHGAEQRLERAALLWAIHHNFEPAQDRSERKRTYRHPGQAPLALAGLPPRDISYLDALAV